MLPGTCRAPHRMGGLLEISGDLILVYKDIYGVYILWLKGLIFWVACFRCRFN